MAVTEVKPITLEEFLSRSEIKPAAEFLNGQIISKPMPQGEHSRLQVKLCTNINLITESQQIAYAFPELRCTFGGASIVPDVSVFRWDRIPRQPSGRVANRFESYPDWSIEILSPDQRHHKVLANLLLCAEFGTELGWLIDPADESILVVFRDRHVQVFQDLDRLPTLNGINLELTAQQIFSWLSF